MTKLAAKKISPAKSVKAEKKVAQQQQASLNKQERIAVEAYLLAEKRGFQGGDPMSDWLQAESQVVQVQG